MPDWRNEECLQVDQSIMASNASSDALGFPVRGMPKTVREKNIIFNVIKYEKERHGNKNLDQMQSCKRQQRQLEYQYELQKQEREFRKQKNKM